MTSRREPGRLGTGRLRKGRLGTARRRALGAILLGHLLSSAPAVAENPDKFYLSGDAALQGGAITADSRGGGSIWYNPAGLAEMPGLRVDVNMNAYSFRFGNVPEFEGAGEGTQVTRLGKLDFSVAPASLTMTKRFGNVGAGFGVFVPRIGKAAIRTRIQQPAQDPYPAIDLGADLNSTFQEYFAGPAFGWHLGPHVDIGGSLFVHYVTQLDVIGFNLAVDFPSGEKIVNSSHQMLDWVQLGLQPTLGVQIHPGKGWHLGMVLRFPSFRLYQIVQRVGIETAIISENFSNTSDFSDETGLSTNVVRPARFHLGLSHDFGKTHLALEGSYQLPFRNAETEEDFRPLFSGRVGGKHTLSETMAVGGGFFVSPSTSREPGLGDAKVDYYGLTAALDLGTPYVVSSRGGTTLKKPGKLIFGTTIALTYSVGLGSVLQAEVGFENEDVNFFREVPVDVTAHEFVLSFGSSLSE